MDRPSQDNDDDQLRARFFGWSDTLLTRAEMLKGIILTVGLGILLYYVAYIKTHVETQRELCSALEDSFNTPFEYVVAESLTDLSKVNSMSMYQVFAPRAPRPHGAPCDVAAENHGDGRGDLHLDAFPCDAQSSCSRHDIHASHARRPAAQPCVRPRAIAHPTLPR